MLLQGHVRQVLSIDFAPDGYHVATGTRVVIVSRA
jgi:hypothetical protein